MGELLTVISSDELTEWAAYYKLEPFGEYRQDLRAAIVSSTVWNVQADKKHKLTIDDFMPRFQPAQPKRGMTADEAMDALKRIAGAFNG